MEALDRAIVFIPMLISDVTFSVAELLFRPIDSLLWRIAGQEQPLINHVVARDLEESDFNQPWYKSPSQLEMEYRQAESDRSSNWSCNF